MKGTRLRVLVVDDSLLSIEALTVALEEDGDIAVVATARDGRDAVAKVEASRPALVAMDINMPVMGGLEAVERIMGSRPTPILLLTGDPARRNEHGVFEALSRGALDVLPKHIAGGSAAERKRLRDRVRELAGVTVVYRPARARPRPAPAPAPAAVASPGGGAVGLVASTGGPPIIADIIAALPADYPLPILIVQHLAPGFAAHLASWLDSVARLRVAIAADGMKLEGGTVYLAPDGAHMLAAGSGRVELDRHSPPVDGHRPSGTRLLSSIAAVWGRRAVGVVLTGMGTDGVDGLAEIRRSGGQTIAQDESSCAVFGMPRAARDGGAAATWLAPAAIAEALARRGRSR